jgi:acetate kinase
MRLLVLNAGSSSLKFDLVESHGGAVRRLRAGVFVDAPDGSGRLVLETDGAAPPAPAPISTLAPAADWALAWLAIEVFCRRARHYLGAYLSELGGVDVIAFGGGIGERSPEVRRRILDGLEWAGIAVDSRANLAGEGSIAAPGSRAAIEVIHVDEASILTAEAAALLERAA